MLAAGTCLAGAGFPVVLYRRAGRALPRGVDGPWAWPPHRRAERPVRTAPRAMTVAPAWGITAAPRRPGALGRPGPWSEEVADLERAYGEGRLLHVSLEEFGRTLTSRRETIERFREGGVPARALAGRLAGARTAGELEAYRDAFRRFRAFERANVLHVFAGFRYDPGFAREYPEAVQSGPLWPVLAPRSPVPGSARRPAPWVWYASPASAPTIAPAVLRGLAAEPRSPRLVVRTPRAWTAGPWPGNVTVREAPLPAWRWRRSFRGAGLRIVTGSRSLLEALRLGGPFLYFNGVLGDGARRRRHRPEKIVEFLALARAADWPAPLLSDLDAFSRGARVEEVVRRAARRRGPWGRFPATPAPSGYAPGFEDAGRLLVRLAREFARTPADSASVVARFRAASHR